MFSWLESRLTKETRLSRRSVALLMAGVATKLKLLSIGVRVGSPERARRERKSGLCTLLLVAAAGCCGWLLLLVAGTDRELHRVFLT